MSRIQWRFERVSRRVSVDEPWTSPIADDLDAMSLDEWLRSVHAGASTRDLMAIMARVTWGCEPDEVSMLHAVRYVKAAGGLDRMLDVEGGAQQDRFPAGTQQIAVRMAEELGDRGGARRGGAQRIERNADGTLTVDCRIGGDVHRQGRHRRDPARAPRRDRRSIPPLPPEYGKLAQHWPQGNLSKAYAAYETPFWRANGCSGEALSDEGPVFITFDVSPGDDGPGHPARASPTRARSTRCRQQQRRERALAGLRRRCSATPRLKPIDYLDHCWGAEEFAPGGPTAAVPPGSWTTYGPWLRKPVDGIFWAGTETADRWTGFLDGAVRSGRRAAEPRFIAR